MKRIVLAAVMAVLAAAMAFAGVQDFGAYTIDVPAGWTATPDDETVVFLKNDNTCSMSIPYASTDGASLKEIADAFVQALNGKNLKQDGDTFTFGMTNANGIDSECYLAGDESHYALFVVTGRENAPNDIASMMDSLTEK